MDRYPLVSALSRPTIVKHLVAAAKKHGAGTVAHGCTGKGNDQVRFEVGIQSLSPELKCIAPVRDYGMTRDKAIAFAEANTLPIETTKKNPYSIDQNLWGRAVETGFLEDIWNAPIEDLYTYTADRPRPARPMNSSSPSRLASRWPSTAGRSASSRRSPSSTSGLAPRASAASTWSRTASSASSPARSTRLPAPSR